MSIAELNGMPENEAFVSFERCCGSRVWATRMTASRPYADLPGVHQTAETTWWNLPEEAWLEAFTAHPRIGDVNSLREKFANTKKWASGEQSGVDSATGDVLQGLADGNAVYEEKYGYIFIVCASGKSAGEMLELLQARMNNGPEEELRIAAGEQMKITNLRIDKWLNED